MPTGLGIVRCNKRIIALSVPSFPYGCVGSWDLLQQRHLGRMISPTDCIPSVSTFETWAYANFLMHVILSCRHDTVYYFIMQRTTSNFPREKCPLCNYAGPRFRVRTHLEQIHGLEGSCLESLQAAAQPKASASGRGQPGRTASRKRAEKQDRESPLLNDRSNQWRLGRLPAPMSPG